MKHKVTCMDCGKTERIIVEHGKKVSGGWGYYGKMNINSCQTDKYHYTPKDPKGDIFDWKRVPNSCYNPKIKRKMVELWSCTTCIQELKSKCPRQTVVRKQSKEVK